MSAAAPITPFTLAIPEEVLADLKRRLAMTRWPEPSPFAGWRQGVPVQQLQELCDYWRHRYDWRRCERMLNGFGQYRTEIGGLGIHFIHVRSPHPNALPIVITHGWPGSVIEFYKVIGPLADPVAYGGNAADAFHVVVPSLPGYGFSDKPSLATGEWSIAHTATAWVELMRRLGYTRFVAQGGDWGAGVTAEIAGLAPPELVGIHLNLPVAFPEAEEMDSLSEKEKQSLADLEANAKFGRGYSEIQRTKPQTLGYGLADSPAGQAAWIYDKFRDWSDCSGDPMNSYSPDEILDNIMLYWLPNSGASSARMYAAPYPVEFLGNDNPAFKSKKIPVGLSVFPKEIYRPARRWAERRYGNVIHWNELVRGGHFAAFEVPDLFVDELRTCCRALR